MQIDRSRFLFWTATIAAGGCSATPPAPVEVPEQTVVVLTPTTPAPPAPVPASAEAPLAPPMPTASARVHPPDEDDDDFQDPALLAAPATCGNTTGRVGNCTSLRAPGPTCESFSDTQQQCVAFTRGLQPRAAEKAVACVLAKSGKRDICQFDAAQKCAVDSLKSVCIEPFSDQPCRSAVTSCGGVRSRLTLQQCQRALSAVTPRNRTGLMTCVAESCSVDYCFYNLI